MAAFPNNTPLQEAAERLLGVIDEEKVAVLESDAVIDLEEARNMVAKIKSADSSDAVKLQIMSNICTLSSNPVNCNHLLDAQALEALAGVLKDSHDNEVPSLPET